MGNQPDPMKLPDNIGEPMSLLADFEIREALDQEYLLRGEFDRGKIRQASIELTLGRCEDQAKNEVERIDHSTQAVEALRLRSAYISKQNGREWLFLNPRRMCILYSDEYLALPINVVGRVNARGQIIGCGVFLESTYVDPGFAGQIHLAAFNCTDQLVRIPIGTAIARLEFMKLAKGVHDPHGGRQDIEATESETAEPKWPEEKDSADQLLQSIKSARTARSSDLVTDRVIQLAELHEKNAKRQEQIVLLLYVLLAVTGAIVLYNVGKPWIELFPADNWIRGVYLSPITSTLLLVVPPFISLAWSSVREAAKRIVLGNSK